MLEFRPLSLEDKNTFEEYMKINFTITCHYSFHSLYAWRDYLDVQVAFYMKALYIKIKTNMYTNPLFYFPISKDNYKLHLNNIKNYCDKHNYKLVLTYLEESPRKILTSISNDFIYENIQGNFDYIYLKENLKSLSGKKLKNKRNFINQFKKNYTSNYTYEALSNDNVEDIKSFIMTFENDNGEDSSLAYEKIAAHVLLDNKNFLNLFGGVIKVNNQIVAFCLASYHPSSEDTVVVHIERANHNYTGASQMINYLFANHLDENITYISREEDFGVLGIRKAKTSYHPTNLGTSYNAYCKNLFSYSLANDNDLSKIKKLYLQTFKDDGFVDYFFDNIYDKNNTYIFKLNYSINKHRDISMATNMPIKLSNDQVISYLFALATKPHFQKQGIMKNLLNNIPLKDVILIPENEEVYDFYKNLGFKLNHRGYVNTFYPSLVDYDVDIKKLSINDISQIDRLYNDVNLVNIKRDKIYKYIFDFHKVYGYFINDELVAYAFLDNDKPYVCESVSHDIKLINILINHLIFINNLKSIDVFNSFVGKEIYYFYKGNIDSKLFVNCLYD